MNIDKHPMYGIWRSMKKRTSLSSKLYNGSTICKEWEDSKVFIKWAEFNHKNGYFLTCYNNHYSPETCEFLPRKQMMEIMKIKEKREATNLKKYGVKNFTSSKTTGGWRHSKEALEKRKKTCLEKYGVDNVFKNKSIKEKQKNTCLDKYGVENVFQNSEIKNKIKQKHINNLGVEYPSQSLVVKDKIIKSNIRKFGKPFYTQTQEYKDRVQKTNLDKYGYEYILQSSEIRSLILSKTKTESAPEIEIKNYLNSFGYNFTKNHDIINGKEIDLYDDNLKIAIEYCGVYFHSEKFLKNKHQHFNKYKECLNNGIRLITIFDDEWIHRKTRVKNFLRSVINKNEKIYARDCDFKIINKEVAKDFINTYHIQQIKRASKLSFGLFYKNYLISVMTFDKHPRGLDELCLNRFCSINNVTVVGGGTKLLKNAIKLMKISKISTWSDNRYSNGEFYKLNGFVLDKELPPDYSYINISTPSYRFAKQSMTKKRIGCNNETEGEYLKNLGYYRIWDCGKKKWVYNWNK